MENLPTTIKVLASRPQFNYVERKFILFVFVMSRDHLVACTCFCFRDNRNNRVSLFDGIEEGGIRASSLYSSSHEIDEHDNEQALDGLQDRVSLLKRFCFNKMLLIQGNDMDSSRGVLSGTMDKFKMVFETKSSRRMFTLVASFVVLFLIIYYLTSKAVCPVAPAATVRSSVP
uniref:Bet1-like SNARE 1-1 n=1 Tax=Cajanus cajan TaxID=3821 RepID=A0A151TUP7_CAJCA|nr:Bet1-like SNARE 1-1 [Cajanus cajan]